MKTMRSIGISVSFTAAFGFAAIACGGSDASVFNSATNEDQGHDPGHGEIADNQTGPSGTKDACVSSTANAALQPANLVMMFDKSGSMGDTTNQPTPYDPNLKWNPVTAGMKAFIADPGSAGINASLQFFPIGEDVPGVCGYSYGTPKVSLSPLTNAAPFLAALDATKPSGGTPTLPALQGAISYAKQIAGDRPTEKPVVVLITDGEPGIMDPSTKTFGPGCADNDIPHVAAAADAAFKGTPSIPTYVIGVGNSLSNMNTVAAAGGTKAAILVDVSDPSKTKGVFQTALDSIRQETMTCDFSVPPAPDGKAIDVNAVNVVYTGTSTPETVLTYSKDCSVAGGWHYDNPSAPTKIQLCQSACTTAKADRGGKLTLAFGCLTKTALK